MIRYFSTFSGIGGFELGIGGLGECVGYSEIDRFAVEIYKKRFTTHKNYGDITTIDPDNIPDFDLICGGFPCQAFSIAGRREGFADTRGTLFFDLARIISKKKPRLVFLENVKGLLSHDGGRTFATILRALADMGYDIQWQVLDSQNFGVPQHRERVFIIGHLRTEPRPEIFPLRAISGDAQAPRDKKRQKVAGTLRAKQGGPDLENSYKIIQRARGKNEGGIHEVAPTLTGKSYQENNHLAIPVIKPDRMSHTQNGRVFKEDGDPSFTLTAQDRHGVYNGESIRKLTPLECERLQGFPDNWTVGISDTQRYKCLGNAVTVNVVRELAKRLLDGQ